MKSISKTLFWATCLILICFLDLYTQSERNPASPADSNATLRSNGDGLERISGQSSQPDPDSERLSIRRTGEQMFLTAVPLAFALLHLLLFLFYPRVKENLYYAAFVFFIAGQNLFNYYPGGNNHDHLFIYYLVSGLVVFL